MSDHAISNAKNWLADIIQKVTDLRLAESGDDQEATDSCRESIESDPLSVQVRDGWRTPGEKGEPHEYEVLLSTGGPALRIYGQLDEHDEPDDDPRLQWQDWGTPWTDYALSDSERADLTTYASLFYYSDH